MAHHVRQQAAVLDDDRDLVGDCLRQARTAFQLRTGVARQEFHRAEHATARPQRHADQGAVPGPSERHQLVRVLRRRRGGGDVREGDRVGILPDPPRDPVPFPVRPRLRQLEIRRIAHAAREAQDLRPLGFFDQEDRPHLEPGHLQRLAQRDLDLPVHVERRRGRCGDGVDRLQLQGRLVQVPRRGITLLLDALRGAARVARAQSPLDLDRHERGEDVRQQDLLAVERHRVVPQDDQGPARTHGRVDPEHEGGAERRRARRLLRDAVRRVRFGAGAQDDPRHLPCADPLDRLVEAPEDHPELVLGHVPPFDPPEAQRRQTIRRLHHGDGAVRADDLHGAGRPFAQDRLGPPLLRQRDLKLAQRLKMRQERIGGLADDRSGCHGGRGRSSGRGPSGIAARVFGGVGWCAGGVRVGHGARIRPLGRFHG